ncbi:hypothetical protein HMPREF9413_2838 [Paenibacillus sp. HGF7]|nr:hypothetical protein HMPREF9413_2838 [Paenibacillus sp. HGF7]
MGGSCGGSMTDEKRGLISPGSNKKNGRFFRWQQPDTPRRTRII